MKLVRFALFAMLLGAVPAAVAQADRGDMVVEVPFAFTVGAEKLPAGHYIVRPESDVRVRIFNSQRRGVNVLTHAAHRTTSDGSKLVFHRYGDTYFLSGVWLTGNDTGRELFLSRAERALADRQTEMELAVVRAPN